MGVKNFKPKKKKIFKFSLNFIRKNVLKVDNLLDTKKQLIIVKFSYYKSFAYSVGDANVTMYINHWRYNNNNLKTTTSCYISIVR
jgi:hypothetical protein